jgi:hypothetical protein
MYWNERKNNKIMNPKPYGRHHSHSAPCTLPGVETTPFLSESHRASHASEIAILGGSSRLKRDIEEVGGDLGYEINWKMGKDSTRKDSTTRLTLLNLKGRDVS